jgi:two-component sensor histidine kinase
VYAPLDRDPDGELAGRLASMGFDVQTVPEDELSQAAQAASRNPGGFLVLVEAVEGRVEAVCAGLEAVAAPLVLVGRGPAEEAMRMVRTVDPFGLIFEDCGPEHIQACLEMARRRWGHEQDLLDRAENAHAVALKEIHHRVKNHLNVVQSFLNLQEQEVDAACRPALAQTRHRIRAVAAVHDLLAHPETLGRFGCQGFLESLVQELATAYDAAGLKMHVASSVEALHPRQMVPLGLIVTELVTNALRHGLSGREDGELSVVLEQQEGMRRLEVRDNGPGLPADFDPARAQSLGLTLVFGLVEQLKGHIRYESAKGLAWEIEFPATDS